MNRMSAKILALSVVLLVFSINCARESKDSDDSSNPQGTQSTNLHNGNSGNTYLSGRQADDTSLSSGDASTQQVTESSIDRVEINFDHSENKLNFLVVTSEEQGNKEAQFTFPYSKLTISEEVIAENEENRIHVKLDSERSCERLCTSEGEEQTCKMKCTSLRFLIATESNSDGEPDWLDAQSIDYASVPDAAAILTGMIDQVWDKELSAEQTKFLEKFYDTEIKTVSPIPALIEKISYSVKRQDYSVKFTDLHLEGTADNFQKANLTPTDSGSPEPWKKIELLADMSKLNLHFDWNSESKEDKISIVFNGISEKPKSRPQPPNHQPREAAKHGEEVQGADPVSGSGIATEIKDAPSQAAPRVASKPNNVQGQQGPAEESTAAPKQPRVKSVANNQQRQTLQQRQQTVSALQPGSPSPGTVSDRSLLETNTTKEQFSNTIKRDDGAASNVRSASAPPAVSSTTTATAASTKAKDEAAAAANATKAFDNIAWGAEKLYQGGKYVVEKATPYVQEGAKRAVEVGKKLYEKAKPYIDWAKNGIADFFGWKSAEPTPAPSNAAEQTTTTDQAPQE